LLNSWASKSGARFEEEQSVFENGKIVKLNLDVHSELAGLEV